MDKKFEKRLLAELVIMNDLKALELFLTGVRQEKIDKILKKRGDTKWGLLKR